jgi:hypothetical protein
MKRIVNYKTFINESAGPSKLTAEQIDFLNRYVKGKWHLNDEGVVDVDGNFNCFNRGISEFKGIKFGKVSGDFDCSNNKLTSLEFGPDEVGGDFFCYVNILTSLKGSPKEVGGSFICSGNNIITLEDAPKKTGRSFDCSHNKLTSLEFGPKEVGDNFNCSHNKLTSLEGAPEEVGVDFYCYYNELNNLKGSSYVVGRDFNCSDNKLTSLEGAPKEIGDDFILEDNEGVSSEILKEIFRKMLESKLDYSDVLKSLWKEISIEDKVLLYTPDLDWVEEDEGSKLVKLKKYSNIKKMI